MITLRGEEIIHILSWDVRHGACGYSFPTNFSISTYFGIDWALLALLFVMNVFHLVISCELKLEDS